MLSFICYLHCDSDPLQEESLELKELEYLNRERSRLMWTVENVPNYDDKVLHWFYTWLPSFAFQVCIQLLLNLCIAAHDIAILVTFLKVLHASALQVFLFLFTCNPNT